jgi:transposase
MPWKESRIVNERVKFIADVLKGEESITQLCLRYAVSRKTGYKWMERFQQAGPAGLEDLGHRPQSCAHATPEPIVQEILKLRFQHPTWGARKLQVRLEQTRGDTDWPAASTINTILRRAGVLHNKKRKRKVTPGISPLGEITAPNQLWCMDFKGFFRCGNRERCDPFTITDAYSRYLIRCQAVPKLDFEHVDAICDAAMREYGLPERIRTDNYNEERPHEALAFATPGSFYVASTRRYPSTLPEPTYGDRFAVRRVRNVGHIKWQGGLIFLSEMLCHELVGLLPIEEDRYEVYFGPVLLGEIDMDLRAFTRVR